MHPGRCAPAMRPGTVAVGGRFPGRQPWSQTAMVIGTRDSDRGIAGGMEVRQCCARYAQNLRVDRQPALSVKQGSSYLDSTIRCNTPRRISKIASEGVVGRFGRSIADPGQRSGQQTRWQTIGHDQGSGVSAMMIAPAASAAPPLPVSASSAAGRIGQVLPLWWSARSVRSKPRSRFGATSFRPRQSQQEQGRPWVEATLPTARGDGSPSARPCVHSVMTRRARAFIRSASCLRRARMVALRSTVSMMLKHQGVPIPIPPVL